MDEQHMERLSRLILIVVCGLIGALIGVLMALHVIQGVLIK